VLLNIRSTALKRFISEACRRVTLGGRVSHSQKNLQLEGLTLSIQKGCKDSSESSKTTYRLVTMDLLHLYIRITKDSLSVWKAIFKSYFKLEEGERPFCHFKEELQDVVL
jgi:hypothetical protein